MKSIRPLRLASSNEGPDRSGEIQVTDHYVLGGFPPSFHMGGDFVSRVPNGIPVEANHLKLSSAMRHLHLLSVFGGFREEVKDLMRELRMMKRHFGDDHRISFRFSSSDYSLQLKLFD